MGSSRWDLLNDMAEHLPILKNNQKVLPLFWFHKTGLALSKTGVVFTVSSHINDKHLTSPL